MSYLAIYINGYLVRTCVFKGKIKYNSGPINFNSPQGFDGDMSNVAYYNRALNDKQIKKFLLKLLIFWALMYQLI